MVFELAGHGFVELVQNAHGGVAVRHLRQDETKAINIGDLRKTQMLGIHLVINGIKGFFTPRDANRQTRFGERGFHFLLHALHQITTALARFVDGFTEHLVAPRH